MRKFALMLTAGVLVFCCGFAAGSMKRNPPLSFHDVIANDPTELIRLITPQDRRIKKLAAELKTPENAYRYVQERIVNDAALPAGTDRTFRFALDPTLEAMAKANPLLARLARHLDCPIHGLRVIRLPSHRFRVELTAQVQPVRDADGKVDIAGTTQAIMSVVEGWIREYPEQWLWLHRRWRRWWSAP